MLTEHAKASPLMEPKTSKLPIYRAPAPVVSAATGGGLKLAITCAFILSVAALAGAGVLYRSLTQEREERATLEAQRVQLQDQIESLQREEEHLQTQVSRLREQLKSYSVENAKIKKELDDRYLDIAKFQEQIRSLENRNSALESQLNGGPSDFAAESSDVITQPLEFSGETSTDLPPTTAPETVETETASPEAQASESASAEPEAAQPEASAPAAVAPEEESLAPLPQVMTVNRKFNFVVVNVGLKDGLKMGDRLEVLRDGQPIAEIQVEKLYDRFAAATILQEVKKFKIEKEDKVRAYS